MKSSAAACAVSLYPAAIHSIASSRSFKSSLRRASNATSKRTDPLAPFGYRTTGPIAAGAFSTVVRARRAGGGGEVAVKSFTKAKYAKAGWLKTALKNELEVLQLAHDDGFFLRSRVGVVEFFPPRASSGSAGP